MTLKNSHRKIVQHRDDLTGEHFVGDAGQLILAIMFFLIWIADSFFLKYTTFLNQYIPFVIRLPIAIVLLVLAAYMASIGLAVVFGKQRAQPVVIRQGLFAIIRHPIYLSEILAYLGLLLINISLAAVLVWTIAIGFLHYISRYEERLLLERFGEEYASYMREVPMWLPKIW